MTPMASPSALELTLRTLAREYASRLVAVACGSNIDTIAAVEIAPVAPPASLATTPPPSLAEPPHLIEVDRRGARVRRKSVDLAHAMVAAVKSLPWPARSRELQALLGLSKTQFIRIAFLAIRMGLVHRTGRKGGIQYFVGPAQPKSPRAKAAQRRR